MIKKILVSILLGVSTTLFAQNEMKEINEIKSNINFIYATGTSTTSAEEAARNAKELIALEIEQWLIDNNTDDIAGYIATSRERLSQIKTHRGNLYRVFVFVSKNDILTYYKEQGVMMVDLQKTRVDSISVADSDVTAPVMPDEIKILTQEPKAEPKPEQSEATTYVPTVREKILMTIDSFTSLNDYINQGRKSGLVLDVGNHKNLPPLGLYYVFIHNREGKIPAYIRFEDSEPINMLTGKKDAISNYKGCGAIWIQLKNDEY